MENTTDIVQRLTDTSVSYKEKKDLVVHLKNLALQQKGVLYIASLTKLFHSLEQLLQQDSPSSHLPELSIQVIELLNVLTTSTDPETEIFLTKFLQNIIPCLGSESSGLRKAVISYVSKYLAKTLNYEAVFAALNRCGLEAIDWKVRTAALEALEAWWKTLPESSALKGIESSSEARKLVQNVVIKLKDSSEIVQKSAQNVLISMTTTLPQAMHILTQKISPSLLSAYKDLMIQEHIEQFKYSSPKQNGIEDPLDEDVKQVYTGSGSNFEPQEWPEMDGLVFGIIPDYIIKELGPTANWKERSSAIEDLKEIINNPGNVAKLEMYFSSFFKFIVRLLNDTNFKVSMATLQIISMQNMRINNL